MTVPFRRVIVLVPLAVALSWAVAKPVSVATQTPAQSAQSMAQRETVAQEVAAALKEYHRLFSSKRADAMAERGYGAPLVTLGRGNYTVLQTRKDVETWAGAFVTRLSAEGWDRSEMPSPSICVLTPTSAIASGEFVRYRKDGSVLGRFGNAYVFSKTTEGWRVVGMLSHDASKPIRCDR
jgi:hypothetical protein